MIRVSSLVTSCGTSIPAGAAIELRIVVPIRRRCNQINRWKCLDLDALARPGRHWSHCYYFGATKTHDIAYSRSNCSLVFDEYAFPTIRPICAIQSTWGITCKNSEVSLRNNPLDATQHRRSAHEAQSLQLLLWNFALDKRARIGIVCQTLLRIVCILRSSI